MDVSDAPIGERVAILDAGSQYGKIIDRRVRDLAVCSDMLPLDTPVAQLKKYAAVIVSGGPQSVYGPDAPAYDPGLLDGSLGRPLLGICYGLQLMNHVLGGTVKKAACREDGQYAVLIDEVAGGGALFDGLPREVEALLTHGDSIDNVAPGFRVTARSSNDGGIVAAVEDADRMMYGVQFHPEVGLTPRGTDMLRNFLYGVTGLKGTYTMQCRMRCAMDHIRERAGDSKVLMLVSGGVDSSVCATLLLRALPSERVHAIHVDHGFMRKDESASVVTALRAAGVQVTLVDAADRFRDATTTDPATGKETQRLCETVDPEVARRIIGDTFMKVSDAAIRELGLRPDDVMLAQGTLRPDLIESASEHVSGAADVIKTHHNDTEMVRVLRRAGRVIEPLADYHKDQVRQLGTDLGLPEALVWRQPFPGPGLAIRILCADDEFRTEHDAATLVALADAERTEKGIRCTLLPCRTVGVQGDGRTYSSLVALSCDGNPDWPALFRLAKLVPRSAHHVNRVVYVDGPQLDRAHDHRLTRTRLTPDVVEQARAADDAVGQVLREHGLDRTLAQVPVVLFPASFGVEGARSVAVRPFTTSDFMTGLPAVPGRDMPHGAFEEMAQRVRDLVPNVARVCIDLTAKPPATTEWQ